MGEPIIRSELARRAGVSPAAAGRMVKGPLAQALTADGKHIDADHPAVRAYIARHVAAPSTKIVRVSGPPVPPASPTATVSPHRVVKRAPAGPPPVEPPEPDPDVVQWLNDFQVRMLQQLPEDLNDLRDMTLGQLVDGWGNFEAMADVVKILKNYADMRNKESLAAKRRGDMIQRDIIPVVLLPLVDMAFRRLVGEAPGALAQQVIARVMSGGEDLAIDVEDLIRNETSGILKDCKTSLVAELDALDARAS